MADITSEVKRTLNLLRDDIRSSDFGSTFRRESRELSDFYLTTDQRERLKHMGAIHKAFHYTGWIFKALFLKLTPFRRLLFLAGIIMLFSINITDNSVNINSPNLAGGALLVLVILLELKDKLLARDELHEGRHIQQLLMPEQLQHFEGWSIYLYTRSANEVCGDLVDFLPLAKPNAAVCIADVAGKGLHAALLTAKLQATIRALAFDESMIDALVGRINSIFHRDSPARLFASLIYAVVTENDGLVRYVNAGHLPPLFVHEGEVLEMEKGDIAVGLTRTVDYHEHSLRLESGDLFVLYSDGVTETKNEHGAFYGKERLIETLKHVKGSPEQICKAIVNNVDFFMRQAYPSDDLSLIVLRRL
jgi:phosphoserine phosphatase RsbU/P